MSPAVHRWVQPHERSATRLTSGRTLGVSSWYYAYGIEPQLDPRGQLPGGGMRTLRGGSYEDSAERVRAAFRNLSDPRKVDKTRGFRVVLPAGPGPR